MNFSEALLLIVRENEKVSRPLWHTEEWQKGLDIYVGAKVWVMALHPNMFGLPPVGPRDRVRAFDVGSFVPLLDSPKLIQVISGALNPYSELPQRDHRVGYWEPDMQDMLANDWEIASTATAP